MSPVSPSPVHPLHRLRPAAVATALITTALAAGLLAAAPGAVADEPPATATAGSTEGRFFTIAPSRVLDTRALRKPLAPGETRTVDLSSAVPAPASAVVVNLTTADGTLANQLTVFPAGTSVPYASSVNAAAHQVRSNAVTVAVGTGAAANKINIYNWYGTTNASIDVLGYYSSGESAPNAGAAYQPLAAPVRLFDTRTSIGALTNTYPRNIGIVTVDYGSAARNRAITSVAVNITAMRPEGSGYLALWNGSGPTPKTSTMNFNTGISISNMAYVPVRCADSGCSKVTFSIYNVSRGVNLVGDIVGTFVTPGAPGSMVYRPVAPSRVVDTRFAKPFANLGPRGIGTTTATTWGVGSQVALMNVTVVRPQTGTYLTLWPNGSPQPAMANVYPAPAGVMTANMVQVRLGANGAGFKTWNVAGSTTVVVDLAGTFIWDPARSTAANNGTSAADAPTADGPAASVSGAITGS